MRKQLALFFVIFLLNFSAPLVRAQGLDGTLRGEVKDQRGTVVVGAKVTVTTEQTDLSRTQVSSSGGVQLLKPSAPVPAEPGCRQHQGALR